MAQSSVAQSNLPEQTGAFWGAEAFKRGTKKENLSLQMHLDHYMKHDPNHYCFRWTDAERMTASQALQSGRDKERNDGAQLRGLPAVQSAIWLC